MTPITQGATVRIIARGCRYYDQTGTIEAVIEGQHHPYHVTGLEPWPLWFGAHEFVAVAEPVVGE